MNRSCPNNHCLPQVRPLLAIANLIQWAVTLGIAAATELTQAQEALRNSMAGDAAAESRRLNMESQAYTVKTGDFRLLVSPSLGLDWNDNVYLSKDNAQDDFILRPTVGFLASYPLTQRNLLSLNVTAGYDKYFDHDELSRWFMQSGSELSFDIFVKDLSINLHDRFSYMQDSAQEAAVANTGSYGTFQNTAGLSGTWDLQDVTLTLGYDHQTYLSTSSQFEQMDRTSEMLFARAGLRVHPRLTVGVEGSSSWTAYDQALLNDNISYSGGLYGEWRPGPYFTLQPRAGYTIYAFEQTSRFIPAQDQNAWYADLTLSHRPTEFVTYSLSAGHELRLGIQSDMIDAWYVRPSATWSVLRNVDVQTSVFYEHGTQTGGGLGGFAGETYDWYGTGLGLSYLATKKLRMSLNYRLTLRASNLNTGDYAQNLISLQCTYSLQ